MSNQELIKRFEAGAVREAEFHHEDHVRLAFAYLQTYPVLEALKRFSAALQRFAASHGKADRYHETITCAYFFLTNERLACSGSADWEEFATRNSDLLVWKHGILERYYEDSTLNSNFARRVFVFPDKRIAQ